jgi:hypothetical protein
MRSQRFEIRRRQGSQKLIERTPNRGRRLGCENAAART